MDPILQQQIAYYRARAEEYDQWFFRQGRYDRGAALNKRWFEEVGSVVDALDRFHASGAVLDLACGTGIWTERLVGYADSITAVDASPEVLRLNEARLRSPKVEYVQADLFEWTPTRRYDAVFFGFWLSHVPPERFESFWRIVEASLRPRGRFFFVDSLYEPTSTARDQVLPATTATTLLRRLNDGREFQIYKIFYDPSELVARLNALSLQARVSHTPNYFLYGEGCRNPSD